MIETKNLAEVDITEYTDSTNFICEQDGRICRVNGDKFKQVEKNSSDISELKGDLDRIASDMYTGFELKYTVGAYTVSGTKALYSPQLDAWNCVAIDVSEQIGKTFTVITYTDNVRPIIFSDDNLLIVDTVSPGTGNPNKRWEVNVTVPDGSSKMFINHYASVVDDIAVEGYHVIKLAQKCDIPDVVQESGDSETSVMSQKAVTDIIKSTSSLRSISSVNMSVNSIPVIDEDVVCYLENLFRGISPKEAMLVSTQNVYIRIYDKEIAIIEAGHEKGSGHIRLYLNDDSNYEFYGLLRYVPVVKREGTRKVLFIGDSMTENLSYIKPLKALSDEGDYKIIFLGTLGEDGMKNEGRGGWAAYNYVTNDLSGMSTNKTNAFWDGSAFNFSYYMENSGIDVPDCIFINLGTNDMIRGITDTRDEEEIERVITASYQTMIESIREYSTTIPIVLWLPPTKSLAGRNNRLAIDKCLRANKWLINKFDKSEYINNRVYLMPTYLFVNPYTDYSNSTIVIDGVEYVDCEEPIHPSLVGGEKIAKGIIRQMMYIDNLIS